MQPFDNDASHPDDIHFHSDKESLQASTAVGCYYCEQQYTSDAIEEYVNVDQTAICPHCGIDSVISLDDIEPQERQIHLMTANHHFFN